MTKLEHDEVTILGCSGASLSGVDDEIPHLSAVGPYLLRQVVWPVVDRHPVKGAAEIIKTWNFFLYIVPELRKFVTKCLHTLKL